MPPRKALLHLPMAAGALLAVIVCDAALADAVSLTPLYLVVVLYSVWSGGVGWGFVFLAASLLASIAIGVVVGHPFASRETFLLDVAGRFLVYLIMVLVAGAARAAFVREQGLARSDGLTGLANRAALNERLGMEIERQRRTGSTLALAYIDCDDFKRVNDRRGHAAGDRLLRRIAGVLERGIRKTDLAARIGGDEFALILPEAGQREAEVVIGKLRRALGALPESRAGTVGFSVGVVVVLEPPPSADWLVNQADETMFAVKRSGKNSVALRVVDSPPGAAKRATGAGDDRRALP